MIARLRGVLVEREQDGASGRVVVECAGVGYEVTVSLATLEALPADGDEVVLRIHTQASENRVALFGFSRREERQLFDAMVTVQNVGPRTAVEMLSGAKSPQHMANMIAEGDTKALTALKGVGKKTADMLVAKLRDRCELMLASWRAAGLAPAAMATDTSAPTDAPLLEDVALALANLGWRSAEVQKVVDELEVPPGATVEVLLRDALRAMPRKGAS